MNAWERGRLARMWLFAFVITALKIGSLFNDARHSTGLSCGIVYENRKKLCIPPNVLPLTHGAV